MNAPRHLLREHPDMPAIRAAISIGARMSARTHRLTPSETTESLERLLRKTLKKPWVAALTTTLLLVVVWAAMPLGNGKDPDSETLPPLSPSGVEVGFSASFVALMFLVLWAVFWIAARSKSHAAEAGN
jgi:cbb3-type cytochrome oxidase subunit 3